MAAHVTAALHVLSAVGWAVARLQQSRMRFHTQVPKRSRQKPRSISSKGKLGARLPTRVEQAADSGYPRIYPDTNPTKVDHPTWALL